MSIGAIGSTSSVTNFEDFVTTARPQTSVSTLVSRLETSIKSGDLGTTESILEAIKSLPPKATETSKALSTFLDAVSTAVKDKSTTEAETALSTYETALTTTSTSDTSSTEKLATTEDQLAQDKLTLKLVNLTLDAQNDSTSSTDSTGSSTSSLSSNYDIYSKGSLVHTAA